MNKNKPLHNAKYLKERRRELRNNATPAEAFLWSYLKSSQLKGRKFRRQHSIDHFIVDFYCPSEQLVVELDGTPHESPAKAKSDFERDQKLLGYGITVIRIENKEIFQATDSVLEYIASHFKF